MGSPSPPITKLKRESPTIRTGPHRRTSSVSSSCVSLESGDQDVLHSPARTTPPGKSPAAASASSPRTPAGANLGEKSAMKKRRSSIGGGADDLVRGLDFSTTSSSPGSEEKKPHSFLTKGGGHKKVTQPVTGQASGSPGKKTGTTPPGKEKLVAGRATSASVLSPRKSSDGRPEISKKDITSVRKSEGSSSVNGMMTTIVSMGNNAEQVVPTIKKTSPLKVSSEGKTGKSGSPHQLTKSKSESAFTKGRSNSNGESTSPVDAPAEAETKTDYKFSPGVSQEGKIGKKSSSRPSLKSKSSLTSSTGRKLTKSRQDTPSPPQPGRVRTRNDKASRSEETLSRPEMESVEVPVYAEYGYEREGKSEDHVLVKMPDVPLQADEERLTLLASLMVGGNVEDEDMSSLEPGVEPGFGNDTEMPTSWLSEDLPCMFSSLDSHLPEPDDSSSNLLGDPPEVLDEPICRNLLTAPNGTNIVAAEVSSTVVSSPNNPISTTNEKFVSADDPNNVSNGVHQLPLDHDLAWFYESNSGDKTDNFEAELRTQIDATCEHESPVLPQVEDSADHKFEDELRTQVLLDATYELDSPQLAVSQVEDPGDMFEAELRTQIDTTFETPQLLVPPVGVLVPVTTITKSVDNGDSTMPGGYTLHPEVYTPSSTSDNESIVANGAASLQSCTSRVTEETIQVTGEGQSQPISSQKVKDDPTEVSMVVPTFVDSGDKEIFHLDPPSCVKHMVSVPDASSPLPKVEDEILTTTGLQSISCPDQLVVESSDDEILEESDSAQLNLKQSFDDVAELPLNSRDRVDEFDTNNIVSTVASSREDNAMEEYGTIISPQELGLPTEPEFGVLPGPFFGGHRAFTPTYDLDQDMKIFEEYWTHSVEDESSLSDAGQNDAEDLQPSPQLLNTVEDDAEKSLPPVELPVSTFPDVGKLKLTVEKSITLEPPGHATKVEIVDEEIPPRILGWSYSPDTSVPLPDNHQVDTANQEEFDEVFHLFGTSEELRTSVTSFEKSTSPSRPKDHIQESVDPILSKSFQETRFENGGGSDSSRHVRPRHTTPSSLVTEHPHELDSTTTQVVPDLQNGDVDQGVTEHQIQDISVKKFVMQDASVDDLHHAWIIPGADPEDQEPPDEGLPTSPLLAMNSNDLIGVNIQHLDGDEESDDHSSIGYLHQGGPEIPLDDPDSLLGTSIQGASWHKSSFETPAMSESHMGVDSNEVLELGPVNPSILQEFCDRNGAALTEDEDNLMSGDCIPKINNSQISSPDRDFSCLTVQVASDETVDDSSLDLGLKILPTLPMVEDDLKTILVSSPSAGAATNGVDPSDSNSQLPLVGGINDDIEQTEAEFLSSLDKEVQEPIYVDGTASLGERQERIEKPIPALEVENLDFAQEKHKGDPFSPVEGAESISDYTDYTPRGELLFNSSELKENFENMSSQSREVKIGVPGQDTSQLYGDDEFQDDERITTTALQIVAESYGDVSNVSEVDHKPQNLQLTSPQGSETKLEDFSTEDGSPSYTTAAALDKSPPIRVFDASSTQHLGNAACTPVFEEEDEKITSDKFDEESEVNATAYPDMVIPGTEATINYTDSTASSTEIPRKDEAIHDVAAPFVVSAQELPSYTTLNEVGEFESQCEVNEENSLAGDHSKLETVDFGEQGRAEQDWEGRPLLTTVDSSGPKSTTEDIEWDLPREEAMFTNESRSAATRDTTEDLEVDQDKSEEEASTNISASASIPSELIAYHDINLQETQLPLGTFTSSDDQVSRTVDAAPEIEEALTTLSDAEVNEDQSEAAVDGHALHDVEIIIPESSSTKNVPLKLFVARSQDTPNADVDDMKEDSDFPWKGSDNDEESVSETLEQNRLPKDVDTVVDSTEKSFVGSDQDTATTVYVDEREEDSSFTTKTERENVYLNGRLEEEPLFEDEEAMAFSPKHSYAGPDTKHLGNSSISWMTDKDEESLNGNVEDEDTVVYSSKDSLDATILGGNEVPENHATASRKGDSEKDYLSDNLEENTFLKDEDMAMDTSVVAILDTDGMGEQSNISWTGDKSEESLHGSLERDSVMEEKKTVESIPLKDPFNASVEETPVTTTPGASDIQNHSNISWTADKDELVSLEDEDTVVKKPKESDQDLPDTAILVDDKTLERQLKSSENADDELEGKENGVVMEVQAMPEVKEAMPEVKEAMSEVKAMSVVEKAMPEVDKAMPEVDKAMPGVDKAMPEVDDAMEEVQETTVVDIDHEEALVVLSNTNAEALIVDDVEKHTTWRDACKEEDESSNGNVFEKESKVDLVQEMVDDHGPSESHSTPYPVIANEEDLNGDEMGKHQTWSTGKEEDLTLIRSLEEKSNFETEVDSREEPLLIPDGDKITNGAATSDIVDELVKYKSTDEKGVQSLNRDPEEEESVNLEVQKKEMDTGSSGNLKNLLDPCQGSEAKQSINSNSSDCKEEELVCHSNSEDHSANTTLVHESADPVHISTESVVSVANAQVVNTENGETAEVADCKPSCVIPEMTNGNKVDCPHETDAVNEAPGLAEKTGVTTSVEAMEEPQSPEAATLYPLLATQPPFSGSQQDRLWEEQAEAYSSGGRGTPSRKEDTTTTTTPAAAAANPSHDPPPSPPGEPPTASDDQIQPASSGPTNNVAGPASNIAENGTTQLQPSELKGKGKLHTPLRSLLLEDASKSADGDSSSTLNGVSSNSPSFIKRLFRVMSTPSRTGERDVNQSSKLHKKSSSMWVSCLGSPQVQQ